MVNIKVKKQKGINKVKQKVSQKVNQKVIVNVGESITKLKRRRAPMRPKPPVQQAVQQAIPRTFYQQPSTDSSNLVSLLLKNLTGQQEARAEVKLAPPPPPKPNELEKPRRELIAQKAEERRAEEPAGQSEIPSFFLPASNLTAPRPNPVEAFTAKFNTTAEDRAEQDSLDRFEKAKRLTALYRQVEGPVAEPSSIGLRAEVRADPEVRTLGLGPNTFLQQSNLAKQHKAKYSGVLDLLLRNRARTDVEPTEFTTPTPTGRLTIKERIEQRARGPPPVLSLLDATERLTAPEKWQPEAELEVGQPAELVSPVKTGPPLAQQLEQGIIKEGSIEPEQLPERGGEIPLSFAFEEPAPRLPAERAEAEALFTTIPESAGDLEPLNLPAEALVEPPPQRRAYTGSELLPPLEGASTVLNQPPVETPLKQLLQPAEAPTLLQEAGIVEGKKKSTKRLEIENLADRSNIKHKGKSNYDVALELSEKGVVLPEGWLVKSKAGKPKKGE